MIYRKNRIHLTDSSFEFVACASNSSRDISKTLFFWHMQVPDKWIQHKLARVSYILMQSSKKTVITIQVFLENLFHDTYNLQKNAQFSGLSGVWVCRLCVKYFSRYLKNTVFFWSNPARVPYILITLAKKTLKSIQVFL